MYHLAGHVWPKHVAAAALAVDLINNKLEFKTEKSFLSHVAAAAVAAAAASNCSWRSPAQQQHPTESELAFLHSECSEWPGLWLSFCSRFFAFAIFFSYCLFCLPFSIIIRCQLFRVLSVVLFNFFLYFFFYLCVGLGLFAVGFCPPLLNEKSLTLRRQYKKTTQQNVFAVRFCYFSD